MTAAQYFAEYGRVVEELKRAHVLHFPHDTDSMYFLVVGEDAVRVHHEADGELGLEGRLLTKAAARAKWRKLLNQGWEYRC